MKAVRAELFRDVYAALTARCRKADPRFEPGMLRQREGPLFKLLTERPAHFLPNGYARWSDVVLAAVDAHGFATDGRLLAVTQAVAVQRRQLLEQLEALPGQVGKTAVESRDPPPGLAKLVHQAGDLPA